MNVLLKSPYNMDRFSIIQMRVRAYNANGLGPWAFSMNSLEASPLKLNMPPQMKIFTEVKDEKILMRWADTLDPTSATAFYEILGRKVDETEYTTYAKLPSSTLNYTLGAKQGEELSLADV